MKTDDVQALVQDFTAFFRLYLHTSAINTSAHGAFNNSTKTILGNYAWLIQNFGADKDIIWTLLK